MMCTIELHVCWIELRIVFMRRETFWLATICLLPSILLAFNIPNVSVRVICECNE